MRIVFLSIMLSILVCCNTDNNYSGDTLNRTIYEISESGDTISITDYNNGITDSTELEFYKSGNLKSIFNWDNGTKYKNNQTFYDSTFNRIETIMNDTFFVSSSMHKSFEYYEPKGKLYFYRKYDKEGLVVSEGGKVILPLQIVSGERRYYVDDTLQLRIYPLPIPECKYNVTVDWYHHDNLVNTDTLSANESFHSFTRKLKSEGVIKAVIKVSMADTVYHNKPFLDSTSFIINVGDGKSL